MISAGSRLSAASSRKIRVLPFVASVFSQAIVRDPFHSDYLFTMLVTFYSNGPKEAKQLPGNDGFTTNAHLTGGSAFANIIVPVRQPDRRRKPYH